MSFEWTQNYTENFSLEYAANSVFFWEVTIEDIIRMKNYFLCNSFASLTAVFQLWYPIRKNGCTSRDNYH